MIPITRKELYLNKIVGNNDYETPGKPITTEEFFFAEILGEAVQAPEPSTRYQVYLAKIAGRNAEIPYPETRLEYFLARAAGMDVETPIPITREEIFWSNYPVIVDFEVEGIPPLTYKAVAGTLKDYRIYGNTVDGESVGDKTGNLFDVELTDGYHLDVTTGLPALYNNRFATLQPITINQGEYCLTYNSTIDDLSFMYSVFNNDTLIRRVTMTNNRYLRSGDVIDTTGGNKIYFGFFSGTTRMISNIMLNEGSAPLPYEPYGYKVPVTVSNGTDAQTIPIYLSEQIRKVGDEAEYVDYKEQKQHRVRKNLLENTATSQTINGVTFTVNNDGSVTCNGTASAITYFNLSENFNSTLYAGMKASFYQSEQQPNVNTFMIRISKANRVSIQDLTMNDQVIIDNGDSLILAIRINTGYTCNNLTFYPMIRKADIEDDTYEPYIENTDLDVTLPALSTIKGTNTLSVGTEVQPCNVYLKGRIKEVSI